MCCDIFFFFNDTATTEIYTLSLHDALPISAVRGPGYAPYRDTAGGELRAVLHGVDTGLGLDGAFLGPGALDPVGVEVQSGDLFLVDHFGAGDEAVEAGAAGPTGEAVLGGELVPFQAEADRPLAP